MTQSIHSMSELPLLCHVLAILSNGATDNVQRKHACNHQYLRNFEKNPSGLGVLTSVRVSSSTIDRGFGLTT